MGDMSFPEEEQLKEEMAPRIEEKKISPFSQKLIRNGFANNPQQAQFVVLILFVLTIAGSVYFYSVSREHAKPEPSDPYVRPIPGR